MLIINFPEPKIGKELIALAINLAASKENSNLIMTEELQGVIDRAKQNFKEDTLIFKFIKTIALFADDQQLQDLLKVL